MGVARFHVVLVPGIILSWRYLQRLKKSGL